MQTSSLSNAVHQAVRPSLSPTTTGSSSSQQSASWLLFGQSWAVREDRLVLVANVAGYSKVQAFLDSQQIIDIEVPTGFGKAVFDLILQGKAVPSELIKNVSLGNL